MLQGKGRTKGVARKEWKGQQERERLWSPHNAAEDSIRLKDAVELLRGSGRI